MSLSTPDSEHVLKSTADDETTSDFDDDSTTHDSGVVTSQSYDSCSATAASATTLISALSSPHKHVCIEPDPASDYSEMAEPVKAHLASVNILDGTVPREPDETDAEYRHRLNKINVLSLAAEFAELKKQDADALPFDLHKAAAAAVAAGGDTDTMSDMSTSESSTSESSERLCDSAVVTPAEMTRDFAETIGTATTIMPPARPNSIRRASDSNDNIVTDDVQNKMAAVNLLDGLRKVDNVDATTRRAKMDSSVTSMEGDFDVYNIETTLPHMDWAMLEQQLKKAAEEEEQQKKVCAGVIVTVRLCTIDWLWFSCIWCDVIDWFDWFVCVCVCGWM